MTVVEIAEKLQLQIAIPDDFTFSDAISKRLRKSHYANKGKRVRSVSLFLQVLGLPRVRDFMNYLGMYDGTYAQNT